MRKLLCMIATTFVLLATLAQAPLFTHFKWFKVEDGLPQSFISALTQDRDGFMWIGTRDGLARYDGRSFKIFRHQYNDTNSLRANVITDLYLDAHNRLWVFYENAFFDLFDPRSFRVKRLNSMPELQPLLAHYPFSFFSIDGHGNFWVASEKGELITYNPVNKKAKPFSEANSNRLLGCAEDKHGNLWAFSQVGLAVSDAARSRFRSIPFPPPVASLFQNDAAYAAVCLPEGRFVIRTPERLIIYNSYEQNFSQLNLPQNLKDDFVLTSLQADKNGLLYLEAAGAVYRLEKNNTFTYLWQYPGENRQAKGAISFLVDKSNVLWFGTNAAGLCKINLSAIPFASFPYDRGEGYPENILKNPAMMGPDFYAIWNRRNWIVNTRYGYAPGGSLFIYSQEYDLPRLSHWKNNRLSTVPLSPGRHELFTGVSYAPNGILYATNKEGGIWQWNDLEALPLFTQLNLPDKIPKTVDLEADAEHLWLTTDQNGLFKAKDGKVIKHFAKGDGQNALPTNQLTDICKDPTDNMLLWIGTRGAGLILWHKKMGLKKVFTTDVGLPNNTIYGIVPDADNHLWLSTNLGLCRFNPKTYATYNFNQGDGLPGNEFNSFRHFLFPDGRIAFGGLDHYIVFHPKDFSPDTFATPVQLVKLLVNNQPVDFTPDQKLLSQPLNELLTLTLPYNKNFLSFEFAGLQFNQPEKIRYRYRLRGYDKEWVVAGQHNTASYTRLPPGRYTLLINASNTSGQWSPVVKELSIRIKPPFWATWWAYTIYVLITLALVRTYWKFRENKIHLQNEIALEQSKAMHLQEVDAMKDRFFSNITHELRTPLTLILTPLEKLKEEENLSLLQKRSLKNAHRNAEQLLRLINELLDVSKIESGQMKVNATVGELDQFVQRCVQQFYVQARGKNIRLTFESQGVTGHYEFDEEKWQKIIFNLLGNAVKFTPENGEMVVSLKGERNQSGLSSPGIQLSVSDTGIGIAEAQLPKIFDRFYTVDDSGTRSHSGTGIGLSLVKELVQLMNGKVEVKSIVGEGATFTVFLPVKKIGKTVATTKQVRREYVSSSQTPPDPVVEERSSGPWVLVVEDNNELRSFLVESLAAQWRVMEAKDGHEAWDLILKELPEIVVSDVMMPGIDGYELCNRVKKDNRTAHISFIMLTARAAHESQVKGLESGADAHITKPFHFDELELRIQNLVQQQQRWRQHLKEEALPEKPLPRLPHVNDIFVQKLYQELDARIDEPGLDVETLAGAMAMNRRTLNRKLKAILNISANDLIRRYRLQKAAVLLSAGRSVSETAYTVGFETPSYFTQCFKEQYGQTPSEFANQKTA